MVCRYCHVPILYYIMPIDVCLKAQPIILIPSLQLYQGYNIVEKKNITEPSSEFSARTTIDIADNIGPHFNETANTGTYLQFYGSLIGTGSIANASRHVARYFLQQIPNTQIYDYSQLDKFDPQFHAHRGLNSSAPVGFFCGDPDIVPRLFFKHRHKIGYFSCVASEIPEQWTRLFNQFDHIIVPSQFCQQVFLNSGVETPISIIAYGLDPTFSPSNEAPSKLEEFWFLNIFADDIHYRKSAEELIRAFMRTFKDETNVKLRLHVKEPHNVNKLIAKYSAHDQVKTSEQCDLSAFELAQLYRSVHTCVCPTQAESFGMIPLESIACGTPVIAPFHTGLLDYLSHENAIEVSIACIRPSYKQFGRMTGAGYIVDEEDLRRCLQFSYENWSSEKQRVMKVQPSLYQQYQWPVVLQNLLKLIPNQKEGVPAKH